MDRYVAEQRFQGGKADGYQVWDTIECRSVCGTIILDQSNADALAREFNQAYEAGKCSKR